MTLRNRLLVGVLAVVVVLVGSLSSIAVSERAHLIEQMDQELEGAAPIVAFGHSLAASGFSTNLFGQDAPTVPFFIGEFDEQGRLVRAPVPTQVVGDMPVVSLADISPGAVEGRTDPFTADGTNGTARFRCLGIVRPADGAWVLLATPMNETDAASRRLVVAFLVAAGLVLAALGVITGWVVRLGLRPIGEVTAVADAIAAGVRDPRVALDDPGTEAGRLGRAFNLMLDERDEREASLRRFVADASHELRTPLTSIGGYLDLYQAGAFTTTEQVDDVVRRMRGESRRMHALIEELLLLARIDEGLPFRRDAVDVGDVVRDAASDARATAPGRSISVDVPDADDLVVWGDEDRLRQVVGGLVQNALQHTPDDASISLSACVRPARGGKDEAIEVLVVDDGPGMAPEVAGRAFERFTRGDPSRSRHAGGAGLGLAIARSVIEGHGGSIGVETAPGSGCAFRVRLPRQPPG